MNRWFHPRSVLTCITLALCHVLQAAAPVSTDPGVTVRLFTASPNIVSPIGIAVDQRNRVFVLESHTLLPAAGTKGTGRDVIKMFPDEDGNGQADGMGVFRDDLFQALNMAFAPNGELYVVQRNSVVVLTDANNDGTAEKSRIILKLECAQTDPHAGLMGIAFGPDGHLYISRGHVEGFPWAIVGSDTSRVHGYGDGGNIIRCLPDGSKVEEVATGFCSPTALEFDRGGRLFCTDNDPESRGPDRLLHVIPDGNYGYRTRFGKDGLHAYQDWEGRLPGTLPMISSTGDVPAGLIDASRGALSARYKDTLLATAWSGHSIDRFKLSPKGLSAVAQREIWIKGDDDFRPVALAAGGKGVIYVTDWVQSTFNNHGAGRIWSILAKNTASPAPSLVVPQKPAAPDNSSLIAQWQSPTKTVAEISVALHGEDPFLRSLAVTALARLANRPQWTGLWQSKDAAIRLGVLLAWRQSGNAPSPTLLQQAVSDPSESVRKIALMWTGETMQPGVAFDRAVTSGPVSSDLLDLYIATLQAVQSDDATWMKSGRAWFQHNRAMDLALARRMVTDESKPVSLRAVILRTLGQETLQGLSGSLFNWAIRAAEPLRSEAVRSLGGIISTDSAAVLRRIALNAGEDPSLRADAILALTGQPAIELVPLASLLYEKEVAVALETARVFSNSRDPSLRLQMIDRLNDSAAPMNPLVREQFEFALYDISRLAAARPSNDIAWSKAVGVAGDAVAGRRVFFLPTVGCAGCHKVHGRGGLAGPDLSGIGRTSPRERLVRSILHPSEEIAPQYQPQIVELRDGTRIHGTQFHVRSEGTAGVWLQDGTFASIPAANINAHYPSKVSIMPEGLVDRMTVSDMRNLIAFLVSLR